MGVEIGTAAHSNLLRSYGLLDDSVRLCSNRPFKGLREAQGLVIDDFFSVCVREVADASEPLCNVRLRAAKRIYEAEGLHGSDDKDLWGEQLAKIAGAEINSTHDARSRGLITVAAPADKRISLSCVSLEAARLPFVTDALWLSLIGSWTSVSLFRRPLMSVFSAVYSVATASAAKPSRPVLYRLPRAAAQELVLMSLLAPLASCDLAAPHLRHLYATDASESKDGYTIARADPELLRPLWRTPSKKGGYSRLLSREESALARFEDRESFDLRMMGDSVAPGPSRPLAYFFDFLEAGAVDGQVTSRLSAYGRAVGPVFCTSNSPAYDLASNRSFEWIVHLVQTRKLKSLLLVPPTLSWAVVSDRPRPQRALCRGLRCLALLLVCRAAGIPATLVCTGRSFLPERPEWLRLLQLGAVVHSTCFCAFGWSSCRDCKFLVFGIDLTRLAIPCCREGLRSPSPSPPATSQFSFPGLFAKALAYEYDSDDSAVRRLSHVGSLLDISVEGLENYLLNDVVLALRWEPGDDWCWRATAHINILESASILRLVKALSPFGPCRVVILVDSAVALHACAKGRSPSRGLMPVLRKIAATCLLAGIYPAFHFVPTRLNPGDCPTRDLPLPEPSASSFWDTLTIDELYEGLSQGKLRRWASNWARLVCLCLGPPPAFQPHLGWRANRHASRLFDSTLGFPGEGPFFWAVLFRVFGVLAAVGPSHVLRPRHAADEKRSVARSTTLLPEGRPVEAVTQKRRDKLLQAFSDWLNDQHICFDSLFDVAPPTTKRLNSLLVCYGRQLYDAGWPYSHYSEVINAVSSKEPGLRRCLQPAWDLAFAWLREEPHSHHVALPWQVLLAAISLSLMWGWARVAGMLALTWGAVMRIGESLAARRSDLLLPGDVYGTVAYALVSISEPKTRFRAARHQSAKLDQPDLLRVVQLAFGHLGAGCRLWPFSPATLRSRFDALMVRLGTDTWAGQGQRRLDLGSLRAGGATWLLQTSEDSEFVRRRGRWLNSRTMEIYIQEISSLQFIHRLAPRARLRVFSLLDTFTTVLFVAEQLQSSSTPPQHWYSFFAGGEQLL